MRLLFFFFLSVSVLLRAKCSIVSEDTRAEKTDSASQKQFLANLKALSQQPAAVRGQGMPKAKTSSASTAEFVEEQEEVLDDEVAGAIPSRLESLHSGVSRSLGALGVLGGGKIASCSGLTAKMCKPCPLGGPAHFCNMVKAECSSIFCTPFCRRLTLKCNIDFGSLEENGMKEYEKALCAQFIAKGCESVLKCCNEDKSLYDFVENAAFGKQFPDSYFPTLSCLEGPTPELCSNCKKNVKVVMSPGNCGLPKPPMYNQADAASAFQKSKCTPEPKKFPGCPAHKSFEERCEALLSVVTKKVKSMSKQFESNACKCMGCCKGSCYYPMTEEFAPGGDQRLRKSTPRYKAKNRQYPSNK